VHQASKTLWHRTLPLSPGLSYVAKDLLQNRYRHGVRLLYAEVKSLELICEVLSTAASGVVGVEAATTESETRRLESARQLLITGISNPPTVTYIAKSVGISPSTLKRRFKTRYGATVFEFGLDCRMRHALYSLSAKRMSVDRCLRGPRSGIGYDEQATCLIALRTLPS
jgi:AraC family transcriptional regulator, transcriptional activator of the genes for pyochelin and ferripyochelin receptors